MSRPPLAPITISRLLIINAIAWLMCFAVAIRFDIEGLKMIGFLMMFLSIIVAIDVNSRGIAGGKPNDCSTKES